MRYRLSILLFLVATLTLSATELRAERRVALVVGNAAYQTVPKLLNPVNDAGAVAALFKKAGFDVVEARTDLGSLELKRTVRDFTNLARDADIAVMYFAGHGIEVGGINYVIPVDARLASDFDAEDEALSLDRIVRALEPARRLRLVVLDACRDNPFTKTMRRTVVSRAVTSGLAKVEPTTTDTLIAFAAKAGSTADDGSGANSPFTTALLKHMAVPGLDVRIAFGRVRDEVLKTTASKQEPFVYGSLGGSTVALVPEPKRAIAVVAPEAPASVNPEPDTRRDYLLAERIGTKEAWESFLAVHSTGLYSEFARSQLAKLTAPGSPKAAVPPPPSVPAVKSAEPEKPAPRASEPAIAVLAPPTAAGPAPRASEPAIAVLTPPGAAGPAPAVPESGELTRQLQTELKRVGCYPGAVDGDWGVRSRDALEHFNKNAGTRVDVKVASLDALGAVRAKTARICPLVCGPGSHIEGDACIADPKVRPVRREAIDRFESRRSGTAPHRAGPVNPNCQSPITVGGRQCCTFDVAGQAPRIICP
ncbi:MAG: caspase family protein [Rhizobiales bacterium]|nr:caspase family protein [Hyphomicrobiales bacterium]